MNLRSPLSVFRHRVHLPGGTSLRALLDMSTSALLACEPSGRVRWCNRASVQLLDCGRAPLVGQDLADLVHSEDAERITTALGAAFLGTEEVVRARARVGDDSWPLVEWSMRRGANHRPLVLVAGRDLSERRAAAHAVRSGEARLRAIVDHSPSAVFVQDLDGRYLLLNQEWAELAGCTTSAMWGSTDEQCQPDNAAVLDDLRRSVVEGGGPRTRDLAMQTETDRRDLLVTEFALRDDDGVAYATCGIATDITDRKRIAGSLADRQRVLETVLQASPDVIALLDAEGKIARISAAGRALLGDVMSSEGGSDMFPDVHPDDFDEVASNFIRLATGSATRARARYRARDAMGRWVTLDTRWQALTDQAGSFMGAVVVSRDVSARLDAEQRLLGLRQGAEQASQAKSDFLSRMSHELRTPLNSILGFGQLLEMDDLSVHQADAVQRILRGGRHLLDIIDEVLDISRLETGHLELTQRPVLVGDVVAQAIEMVTEAADRADVVVRVSSDYDQGAAVLADRRRLLQVVDNLLSNAVKYNRPGGRVEVSIQVATGGRVRIAVTDTGHGIRPDDMDRVFEPFDRLGAEQSGIEGTGVGLALSRALIEKMGGLVEVESVPEVGSTFSVALPVAVVGGSGMPAARAVPGLSGTASFRVLLVEPDLSSLELLERALARRPGVIVESATRGDLALDAARIRHPELILVDLHLPDMPGSTLLEHLGEDDATAGIPVAVLSAQSASSQLRRLLGRGVAGQVTKPIDVRALLSLVDAVRAASGR